MEKYTTTDVYRVLLQESEDYDEYLDYQTALWGVPFLERQFWGHYEQDADIQIAMRRAGIHGDPTRFFDGAILRLVRIMNGGEDETGSTDEQRPVQGKDNNSIGPS